MRAPAQTRIPGYVAGTWTLDPVHTEVGFLVRHMVVAKVRGRFTKFEGKVVTAEDPSQSFVEASVDMNSIETGNSDRDNHLRSSDFFEVQTYPTMTYRSTGIREQDGGYVLDGELTLKGVTRQVPLRLEINGFGPDAYGGTRAGFSASGEINRRDFNVNFNAALETGGLVVADKVQIQLEVEAVLQ